MEDQVFPLPVTCEEIKKIIDAYERMIPLYERHITDPKMQFAVDIWQETLDQSRFRVKYLKDMLTVYDKETNKSDN